MCDVCRQTPCPPMCPNADAPKVIGHCDHCEAELLADTTFFIDYADNTFCSETCALAFYGVREEEYDETNSF